MVRSKDDSNSPQSQLHTGRRLITTRLFCQGPNKSSRLPSPHPYPQLSPPPTPTCIQGPVPTPRATAVSKERIDSSSLIGRPFLKTARAFAVGGSAGRGRKDSQINSGGSSHAPTTDGDENCTRTPSVVGLTAGQLTELRAATLALAALSSPAVSMNTSRVQALSFQSPNMHTVACGAPEELVLGWR